MSGPNELGGAPKLGAHASRRDNCLRLAAANQSSCIGLHPCASFDRHRFSGQHRLVEQNFSAGERHIRRHHAAKGKLHEIAEREFRGRHGFPHAVTFDRSSQRKP